ncbi:unnamed protein product [Protopolystoma xenopodis]|uniref:Uncharacterized protein n=1 Tax=Protopolystoma xenopodis TaxID=117903 RepID=A0A3S5BKH8_9PLAT|nr:unnamed protein product [Protopolystoma xenopodis]
MHIRWLTSELVLEFPHGNHEELDGLELLGVIRSVSTTYRPEKQIAQSTGHPVLSMRRPGWEGQGSKGIIVFTGTWLAVKQAQGPPTRRPLLASVWPMQTCVKEMGEKRSPVCPPKPMFTGWLNSAVAFSGLAEPQASVVHSSAFDKVYRSYFPLLVKQPLKVAFFRSRLEPL